MWALSQARVKRVPVIFVPASPALVPELGIGDASSARLRDAARSLIDAALSDPRCTQVTIVGSTDPDTYTAHTGSFRAWGADVSVGGGNHLAELVARYLLGPCHLPITSGTWHPPYGHELVIYPLDGPAGLTDKAPLAKVPGAPLRHQWCQKLLRGEDVHWPADLERLRDDGIIDPDHWWALRGSKVSGSELVAADEEHGVGRYVAQWKEVH